MCRYTVTKEKLCRNENLSLKSLVLCCFNLNTYIITLWSFYRNSFLVKTCEFLYMYIGICWIGTAYSRSRIYGIEIKIWNRDKIEVCKNL